MCRTEDYMSDEFLKSTQLLIDVFDSLNIHHIVGIKMFVKNVPIDEHKCQVDEIPFYGDDLKIYRMNNLMNFKKWRISNNMADKLVKTFNRLLPDIRYMVLEKSETLKKLEKASINSPLLQNKRILLGLYENNVVTLNAIISDYRVLSLDKDNTKLKVSLKDLRNPETGAIYADHTHVLIRDHMVRTISKLPIGTKLEFNAVVHSYSGHNNGTKYGIHNIHELKVLNA